MNIAFVGSEIKGNFALDVCNIRGDNIEYLGQFNHVNMITDMVLANQYTAMIFDLNMFIDDSVTIAEEIEKIQRTNNAKVIVYAPGYTIGSEAVIELLKRNYKNFIFAVGLASKKDELEKCLNGYYEENDIRVLQNEKVSVASIELPEPSVFKSIGVCGALGRIGTTTQCMQVIKYLNLKGHSAAYIEMNDNNYLNGCITLYSDVMTYQDSGKIEYANITMYHGTDIPEVLKSNFEYLVYDYGSFLDNSFQKGSYLEKDVQIMVCGAKPNEIEFAQRLLQSQYYKNVFYLFSFIPEADKKDIKEMMRDRSENTFFAEYQPDPFTYSSNLNKTYESFLSVPEKSQDKKKLHFFKRG